LDLLYLIFIGACEVAEKYNQQEAMKELITVSKIQKWFLRYEAILEKSNYLGDVEVEEKWNLCLNALYKLEGEIRLKAYSNQQKVNSDKQFLLALTAKSKETLGGVFLRHVA
jgi:hypothetical protein